jgi:hypothetical protein
MFLASNLSKMVLFFESPQPYSQYTLSYAADRRLTKNLTQAQALTFFLLLLTLFHNDLRAGTNYAQSQLESFSLLNWMHQSGRPRRLA